MLNAAETRALWAALEDLPPTMCRVFKIRLLTGQLTRHLGFHFRGHDL